MTVAVMQPYFLPYLGYFQLIAAVDTFVIYDNIKYTKKGWINRNRMLGATEPVTFSVPLKKASDFLDIGERQLADTFEPEKLLNLFRETYRKAPFYEAAFPVLSRILLNGERNLFVYLRHSIIEVCHYLGIETEIRVSSTVNSDHGLRAQDRVIDICQALKANRYINAIGGTELYSATAFEQKGIELRFIKSRPLTYPQFGAPFVPWLSIADVMMFNSADHIRTHLLPAFDLVENNYEV